MLLLPWVTHPHRSPHAPQNFVPTCTVKDVDGHLSTSDNPLRLKDGSLIVQVAVCLGDRVLGWNGNCGLGSMPCGGDFGSVMQGALPLYASVLLFWKVSGSTTAAAWRSRRREFARRSVLALPRWIANAMESTKSFFGSGRRHMQQSSWAWGWSRPHTCRISCHASVPKAPKVSDLSRHLCVCVSC